MNYIKKDFFNKLNIAKVMFIAVGIVSLFSVGFVLLKNAEPIIHLIDSENIVIDYDTAFDYTDYVRFENTETVNVVGEVDTKQEGTYLVVVEAVNEYNQTKSQELNVTVKDLSAPKITLTKEKVSLAYGSSFNPNKYIKSAIDNKDGDVSSFIEISSKVNSKKAGTYDVIYTVEDNAGNSSSETLKVTIKKQTARQKIVEVATSKIGCKYVWGAIGPKTFDCSGLTKYCYKMAGVSIPRSSYYQKRGGKVISLSQAKPGDIVWRPGHVGIYVGNGKVIHAPQTGKKVSYIQLSYFDKAICYL